MIKFWQRLFFPKTVALFDREAEIQHQREMIQKLVDAVCRGRGEQPAFAAPDPPSPPARVGVGPDAEQDEWIKTESVALENRLVREAVESAEGYNALWIMAEEGVPGADVLLEDADRKIEEREIQLAAYRERQAAENQETLQ